MLRIVTLDLKTFSSSLSFVQVDSWGNSEALLFQLSPPPEEPKGTTLPAEAPDVRCYGEQGGGGDEASDKPCSQSRDGSSIIIGGETQTLRSGSDFCLHERGPWIPQTRADQR